MAVHNRIHRIQLPLIHIDCYLFGRHLGKIASSSVSVAIPIVSCFLIFAPHRVPSAFVANVVEYSIHTHILTRTGRHLIAVRVQCAHTSNRLFDLLWRIARLYTKKFLCQVVRVTFECCVGVVAGDTDTT